VSYTRDMIEDLRVALGESSPLPPPKFPQMITPKVKKFFLKPRLEDGFAEEAAKHTTALVGIGHVGTRYATDVVLQFQAELAVAHEAVSTILPDTWGEEHSYLRLQTKVSNHREFLLRPDLGRRLNADSLARLEQQGKKNIDIQPILADGLSAVACMGSGVPLLDYFIEGCLAKGWTVGTPMVAKYARVWLEDEIGETVNAKVAVILLGERPGLGTGDGLSAYMVFEPKIGKTDGQRNMISNIHERGIIPERAAQRLVMLAEAMMNQRTSGVALALEGELGEAAGGGYREAQKRVRLVGV